MSLKESTDSFCTLSRIMEYHNPVMLNEAVDGLNINSEGYFIDATFGGGGHSKEILKRLSRGKLIAFDKDKAALKNKIENKHFELVIGDFRHMATSVSQILSHPVDGLLADLGVSSCAELACELQREHMDTCCTGCVGVVCAGKVLSFMC